MDMDYTEIKPLRKPLPAHVVIRRIQQAELNIEELAEQIINSIGKSDFLQVTDSAIRKLGVELTSQRAMTARNEIKLDPKTSAKTLATMVKHERQSREMWIETALEPWCKRHGITLRQGLSILFDDSEFDPLTGKDDLPTKSAIFSWGGQEQDFSSYVRMEIDAGVR